MNKIIVVEKPEWISFEDIHRLLFAAHADNRANGLNVKTAFMSGEELEHHLGDKGKCFVALDGDKLVGTISFRIIKRNYWCVKGDIASINLLGVLPEYKGKGISPMLRQKCREELRANGYQFIEGVTQENNKIVQNICLKNGYHYVDYFPIKNADYYSVAMLKWPGQCPYSEWYMNLRFQLKKWYVRLRFKPGGKKRF